MCYNFATVSNFILLFSLHTAAHARTTVAGVFDNILSLSPGEPVPPSEARILQRRLKENPAVFIKCFQNRII